MNQTWRPDRRCYLEHSKLANVSPCSYFTLA